MEQTTSPRKGWFVKVFSGLCAGQDKYIELEERGKEPLVPVQEQRSEHKKPPKRVIERIDVDG